MTKEFKIAITDYKVGHELRFNATAELIGSDLKYELSNARNYGAMMLLVEGWMSQIVIGREYRFVNL